MSAGDEVRRQVERIQGAQGLGGSDPLGRVTDLRCDSSDLTACPKGVQFPGGVGESVFQCSTPTEAGLTQPTSRCRRPRELQLVQPCVKPTELQKFLVCALLA